MPTTPPLFSLVIPTYNRAHLILKTIESVLRQEFANFEILVVDDGSVDETGQVVQAITDPRVHYYKKKNEERGAARNFGVARARGSYVNFLDSDDLLHPTHLSAAAKMISVHQQPAFFHLGYDYQNDEGQLIRKVNNFDGTTVKKLLFDNQLSCCGVFLRKDVATQFPFKEDRVLASSEDWELWIRILCRFPFNYSNEVTSIVVNHDMRSLRTVRVEQVIPRDLELVRQLQQDPEVMASYGRSFHRFIAERYTFFMLSLGEQHQRMKMLTWAWRSFRQYPLVIFSRRFLASIKKLVW